MTKLTNQPSNLQHVLESGGFAVTGELGPPKGCDPDVIAEKAGLLKGVVDAVNITDNQTAVVRMSSIAAALLAQQAGVEPVVQMVCRDRNRIAMRIDNRIMCGLVTFNNFNLTVGHIG